MAILGQHTGHPVIGTSTWTISHQPRPMNITWRLISPHSHSWVTSKIGPVSLNTHRSTVCIQNSLPSGGSQFWWWRWETILHPFLMARSQAIVTATLMNGHQMPRSLLTWSHHANARHLPRVTWSPAPLAAHLSQARLLSPHSAFLKYSGISKLSKVNPDQGLPRIS